MILWDIAKLLTKTDTRLMHLLKYTTISTIIEIFFKSPSTSKSTAENTLPTNRTSQIKMLEAASNSSLSRAREPAPSEATSRVRAQTPAIALFHHFFFQDQ